MGTDTVRLQVVNMAALKYVLGLLALLAVSAWAEEEDLSVGELLWKANKDVVHTEDEPYILDDIAYMNENERNADPCTSRGCMWGKSTDGKVYVPYVIRNQYSSRELQIIERGLQSFSGFSCIRFVKRTNQRDYLHIQSLNGCYSFVGRQGNGQPVSLQRRGCIFLGTIQHELLHALGFDHEQTRSDRDQNVRILLQNVQPGTEGNFRRIQTRNLNTPYNYRSVMHYSGTAFSRNGRPTIVPIPNPNVRLGNTQMV